MCYYLKCFVLARAVDVGLRQGKVIITVKDSPGFYTTRLIGFLLAELNQMLIEGVSPSLLDKASRSIGWPVGLATLADEVGIDVGLHVENTLREAFGSRITVCNSH